MAGASQSSVAARGCSDTGRLVEAQAQRAGTSRKAAEGWLAARMATGKDDLVAEHAGTNAQISVLCESSESPSLFLLRLVSCGPWAIRSSPRIWPRCLASMNSGRYTGSIATEPNPSPSSRVTVSSQQFGRTSYLFPTAIGLAMALLRGKTRSSARARCGVQPECGHYTVRS